MMPENFRDVLVTKLNEEESLPLTHDAMLAALDEFESAAEKQEGDDVWEHYEDAEQVWGIYIQYIKDSNMEEDVPEPIESEEPSEEETPKPKKKAKTKKPKKEAPSVEAEQEEEEAPAPKKNPKKKPVKEEEPVKTETKKPKNSKKKKEAPEPKKNSKKDVPEKPKVKKDKEEKKPSVDRPGVVKAIVDKLKEGWTTKKDVHEHLCEEFSDRDPDKMKNTVQTQIHHKDMLRKKWNVEVKKGEGNEKLYRIKGAAK